jgi:hypothetical protein
MILDGEITDAVIKSGCSYILDWQHFQHPYKANVPEMQNFAFLVFSKTGLGINTPNPFPDKGFQSF